MVKTLVISLNTHPITRLKHCVMGLVLMTLWLRLCQTVDSQQLGISRIIILNPLCCCQLSQTTTEDRSVSLHINTVAWCSLGTRQDHKLSETSRSRIICTLWNMILLYLGQGILILSSPYPPPAIPTKIIININALNYKTKIKFTLK